MTVLPVPCDGCPWASAADRDRAALTDEVKAAAARGDWFCCHVNMGTCWGSVRYAKSGAAVIRRKLTTERVLSFDMAGQPFSSQASPSRATPHTSTGALRRGIR